MMRGLIPAVCAAMALSAEVAEAQQSAPITPAASQSLDDAWWTGPMLAPSAATLPQGHFLIEPYLYDVTVQGAYDRHRSPRSAPHANEYGSLTYALYGLTDRLTVGMIPTGGYNQVSGAPGSAGIGLGDLTVQAQYRLTQFHQGKWIPTTSFAVQETLPTGKYDQLGHRPSNGFGSGAWNTTLAFYSQTYFWLPNGRILRTRFNFTQSFSSAVNVQNVSIYGTPPGFSGQTKPGSAFYADAAGEYSLTRNWVLALDATYRTQGDTLVTGTNLLDQTRPAINLDLGSNDAIAFAPAVEYSWRSYIGVLLGARIVAAGRNTAYTITPAIAVNFVH